MKIGIDIDDTITNTYDNTIKIICNLYNQDYNELIQKQMNYDDLIIYFPKAFSKEIYEKSIKIVKLKKDVKRIINKLSQNNEIFIITARNKNECSLPYNMSYNYLIDKGIKFDKLFVEVFDKGKCCNENKIDLFIDDSIKNCQNVIEYGIDTILFDNVFNKNSNIKRFDNWIDIYEYIERNYYGKNNNK